MPQRRTVSPHRNTARSDWSGTNSARNVSRCNTNLRKSRTRDHTPASVSARQASSPARCSVAFLLHAGIAIQLRCGQQGAAVKSIQRGKHPALVQAFPFHSGKRISQAPPQPAENRVSRQRNRKNSSRRSSAGSILSRNAASPLAIQCSFSQRIHSSETSGA